MYICRNNRFPVPSFQVVCFSQNVRGNDFRECFVPALYVNDK